MTAIDATAARLDPMQRRLLVGVCLVVGATIVLSASFNYIIGPMLTEFSAAETHQSAIRQLPNIAALLVVFLSGVIGERVGDRRVLRVASVTFTIGAGLVALAPNLVVVELAMVATGASSSAIAVVGLGLVTSRITDPGGRATAYSTYGTISPLIYMFAPVAAGLLADLSSWRWATGLWALGGVVMIIASWTLLPDDLELAPARELWTPLLAGVALAAGVQTIQTASLEGISARGTVVRAVITAITVLAVALVHRRSVSPSLSFAAIRRGGMLVLLAVVALMPFTNLWFYVTLLLRYVEDHTVLGIAVLMIPAQAVGIAGALVSRACLRRYGITTTGVVFISVNALVLLATAFVSVSSPQAVLIILVGLYTATSIGSGIPITNAVMNSAPHGEEGSAAAFRGASSNIGSAIGLVVMSAIVFASFQSALTSNLRAEGVDSDRSHQIAEKLRTGSSSVEIEDVYAVPSVEVERVGAAQDRAMLDAFNAHGIWGAGFTGFAAVVFFIGRRRQMRAAEDAPASATAPS